MIRFTTIEYAKIFYRFNDYTSPFALSFVICNIDAKTII